MTRRELALEDVKASTVEDLLTQVASRQEVLTVQLPDGAEVRIEPVPKLEPLPVFDSSIAENWKDAIYDCE